MKARQVPPANVVEVGSVEDFAVPGEAGPIPIRLYRPATWDRDLPLVVYCHGGGFVFGDLDGGHDGLCREMVNAVGAVVISVDYRLAPETRAPGAVEDVYIVLQWAVDAADSLGISLDRLCVAGDSAGGNLAGAVSVMTHHWGGPTLAAQVLIYPVVAPNFTTNSYLQYAEGYFNTRAAMQWYWEQYAPTADLRSSPLVNLLSPVDRSGLPPTIVIGAECDPLYSEGLSYAQTLEKADVPVVHRSYPDTFHGFLTMPAVPACARARRQLWEDLSAILTLEISEVATPGNS